MSETQSHSDADFMKIAINLAKKGLGNTNPNPLVGAVIVKDGKIIGQGYHKKYGSLHAEREALKDCKSRGFDARGSVMYVTLEPCCHTGKQPPCTEVIIAEGVQKVFVGSRDPNPLVSGGGVQQLKEKGIEVIQDFLRKECDSLNPIFFHYITNKKPYVAIKWAMTADGKIATVSGKSKWITGEKARSYVHTLRQRYSCILCGIGTVLNDNPTLNTRLNQSQLYDYGIEEISNPVRIICDSNLRLPLQSNIVKTAQQIKTIVATTENPDSNKKADLEKSGIEVLECGKTQVDLKHLVKQIYEKGLDSILIEGGADINFCALQSGIVNHIYSFIAPKAFGGSSAKTPIGGTGFEEIDFCSKLKTSNITIFDDDILIEYDVLENEKCSQA